MTSVEGMTHAKRMAMMALMVSAMLGGRYFPRPVVVESVVCGVVLILAGYSVLVAMVLRRAGAGRSSITRTIIAGILPGRILFRTISRFLR